MQRQRIAISTQLIVVVLAIALRWCLVEAHDATASIEQCERAAPKQLSTDESSRLCAHATAGTDRGPAHCVSAVFRSSSSLLIGNADAIHAVIELCKAASDSGPADCWAALPVQMHRSTEWRDVIVGVCKTAKGPVPAQCLQEFQRHGFTTIAGRQRSVVDLVVEICRSFQGKIDVIGTCLSRSPRSLGDMQRYALCRRGSDSVADIVDCANHLLRRSAKPEILVHVCAFAQISSVQPQQCVLAAQQQLRWMDSEAISHLCERALSTSAPVQCVTALRSWFITQFSKAQPLLDLARLCQRAVDADAVAVCAMKLPSRLFNANQVVRLCASRHSQATSSITTECVVIARQQLFGVSHHYHDEETQPSAPNNQASLLLALCEDATSLAPIGCLTSTGKQSPLFTADERIALCRSATSAAPHQCFRAIHSSILSRFPVGTADAIDLCREATTIAPAACVNHLHHASAAFFQSGLAILLCKNAGSASPAACLFAAPHDFSDENKVVLCQHAKSDDPAACAKTSLPRIHDNAMKAQLCAQASSIAPVKCASSSPFGLAASELVQLCHQAVDDMPAQCARMAPSHLRLPWSDVAAVCRRAMSSTPSSCLAHRVRQRVPVNQRVIEECRSMTATASTIDIVQFAYECKELIPRCPVIVKARVLDQFGDEMPSFSYGSIQFTASADGDTSVDSNEPVVHGATVSPIANGTAIFRGLHFTTAGNFTLRLISAGVDDMIARVHVHVNEAERRERRRCDRIFASMQCGARQPVDLQPAWSNSPQLQLLMLPAKHVLVGLSCELLWADHLGGLKPLGRVGSSRLYALPHLAYQLLTGHNIPTPAMSSWERLGLPEGSNRSAIRRAYHRRSLEWHPDKWNFGGEGLGSAPFLRSKVEAVYALINTAYEQLFFPDSLN